MCQYCETKKENYYTSMKNLPIVDDYTEELIIDNGEPVQYIRISKFLRKYSLITELANEEGDILDLPIKYCPMCGRKLGD